MGSLTLLPASSKAPTTSVPVDTSRRQELLSTREAVWRAWFAHDRAKLESFLPDDTLAINNGQGQREDRADVLKGSDLFAAAGGKLVSLAFPRTEIQFFGNVAALYSEWAVETETRDKRESSSGRATEIFVEHKGRWLNSGWHLDSGR